MSNEEIKLVQKIFSRKNIKNLIKKNQKFSSEDSFFYEISPLLITLIYLISKKIIKKIFFYIRTNGKNEFLVCQIRGETKTKIYDETGNFTEEYHRINLIKAFLKIGFPKESINLNRKIHIGHKGKNHI